jgi:hypothetical protein
MKTTIHQLYPDIWHQVFEYFDTIELFFSFLHITITADELLLNRDSRLRFRGLVVDISVQTLPEKLSLSQVISLELHQETCLDIIEQCSELRSLKLIGQSEWVLYLLRKVLNINMKLERLILVVPGVGSLHNILASVESIFSLRRLEIYANELEERIQTDALFLAQTKIEQFILHSCSSISWDHLSYMLPGLTDIHFLDITLFPSNNNSFCSCVFPKIRCIYLILLEVSFESIIQLVRTTPSLMKLKLNGLVNGEGFVINNKWHTLFKSCSSLIVVIVSVSLEEDTNSFRSGIIQGALREINLHLKCIDDDYDYYLIERNQQRWWNLSGMIIRQHGHM